MAVAGALFSLWLLTKLGIFSAKLNCNAYWFGKKKRNLDCRVMNQLREQGKPKLEAILEASKPINLNFNDEFWRFHLSTANCIVSERFN
jgi:hypothetical protein